MPDPWLKPLDADVRGGLKRKLVQKTDGEKIILTPRKDFQTFRKDSGAILLASGQTVTVTATTTVTVDLTQTVTITATVTVTENVTSTVTVTVTEIEVATVTVTVTVEP